MKFTLEIEFGTHEGMMHVGDIGRALVLIGNRFKAGSDGPDIRDAGKILTDDALHVAVGKWEIVHAARIPKALIAHEYQPNDLGTDGCSECGKAKAWRFHSYIRGKA